MPTYDERENQTYEGQPVECYRIVHGETVWLYTSAAEEITLPTGVFVPEVLTGKEASFSQEDSDDIREVSVPATNPVAQLFVGEPPTAPVWITAFAAHRGDESNPVSFFTGKVTRARVTGSEAVLVATNIEALIERNVPVIQMQAPCNHVLYSAECGADPTACRDSVTVTTVDGVTVTSNDFALRSDQWFRGGRLVSLDGEMRFIGNHEGDTVTLLSPMPGLASLDQVWAYWGCDRLESTCRDKFSNLDNHMGWSRLPGRNPFRGRIDSPYKGGL